VSRPLVRPPGWCLFSWGRTQAAVTPRCSRPAPPHTQRVRNCRKTPLLPSRPIRDSLPVAQTVAVGNLGRGKAQFHTETPRKNCYRGKQDVKQSKALRRAPVTTCRTADPRTPHRAQLQTQSSVCTGDPRIAAAPAHQGRALGLAETKARLPSPCRSRLPTWEQPPWSPPARAWSRQPHGTRGGRGAATGPPRGWV